MRTFSEGAVFLLVFVLAIGASTPRSGPQSSLFSQENGQDSGRDTKGVARAATALVNGIVLPYSSEPLSDQVELFHGAALQDLPSSQRRQVKGHYCGQTESKVGSRGVLCRTSKGQWLREKGCMIQPFLCLWLSCCSSSQLQVFSCGGCTWEIDSAGLLTVEGNPDCGTGCDLSKGLVDKGIKAIDAGSFDRAGLSQATVL